MPVRGSNSINKLILLFVFDKMEIPLSQNTVEEMCCQENDWISYMDCKLTLAHLIEDKFLYEISTGEHPLYAITPNGRVCLADFFVSIPMSIREHISLFVKKNRVKYRRKQEYIADYFMNNDGTYTVSLKIVEPIGPQLDLKLVVPSRQVAKNIYKKWPDKAENLYATIYDHLVD